MRALSCSLAVVLFATPVFGDDKEKVEQLRKEIAELRARLLAKEAELAKLLPAPKGLDGYWVVVEIEVNGKTVKQSSTKVWGFNGEALAIFTDDDEGNKSVWKADTKVTPHTFTQAKVGEKPGLHGIYRIENDELLVCAAGIGDPLPTQFATTGEGKGLLLTRLVPLKKK